MIVIFKALPYFFLLTFLLGIWYYMFTWHSHPDLHYMSHIAQSSCYISNITDPSHPSHKSYITQPSYYMSNIKQPSSYISHITQPSHYMSHITQPSHYMSHITQKSVLFVRCNTTNAMTWHLPPCRVTFWPLPRESK